MLSSLTHISHLPFPALHHIIMLTTNCVPFSLSSDSRWFLEMSPRSRNKKEEESSSITALVPLWAPDSTLRELHGPRSQLPGHLSTNSHPTQLGAALSLRSSCSQGECSSDPGGSPGTKQERPWGMHVMGVLQHAGDYAPQGHPSHQRATGKWHKSGSMPAPAPPTPAPTLLQHLPSFPKVALTFLPFKLSSLCFFFPMQWSLHLWA